MPGLLYQGENGDGRTGSENPIDREWPAAHRFLSSDGNAISREPFRPPSAPPYVSPCEDSEDGTEHSERIHRSIAVSAAALHKARLSPLEGRHSSLPRGDHLSANERRLSLQPFHGYRERSYSHPYENSPRVVPPATGEYLAGMALQSALFPCALPTIRISQDASQGESNVEDGTQPPRLPLQIGTHTSGSSKSPSRAPSKPPSCSTPSSTTSRPPYQLLPSTEQENQELPTDQSDTAESDQDKEKEKSPEIIVCPNIASHHIGREVSNAVYGLPIDTLFTLLFTNSKFMLDLHLARKTYDVATSSWQSNPETNQKIRQVTYTLTLPTNSFGPKVSHVTETQVISSFSKPSEIYTVDAEASNNGIPYADSFFVSNHWCLTRESATETRLVVWSQVKYKKNVWGFMKSVIDKNACSGMEGLISDLNASLILEVDRTNLKKTKRRRRRAGSKASDPEDPILQLPSPGIKLNEINKATQIPSRKMKTEIPPVNSSIKSLALFILCTLLAVNAFLYYRLYDLEERIVSNVSFKSQGLDASLLKLSASSGEVLAEEWVRILHQQEALHAQELERWRNAVMEAADYLKKAEESLRNLHASIPNKQASKMQALLQQLQILKQMQEQKSSSPPLAKAPLFSSNGGPTPGKMGEPPPKERLDL